MKERTYTMKQWDAYLQMKIDVLTARNIVLSCTNPNIEEFNRKSVISIHRAGWSVETIADVMNLSTDEVTEILEGSIDPKKVAQTERDRLKAERDRLKAEKEDAQNKLKNVVINSHNAGLPVETISSITSLSIKEISKILKSIPLTINH